MTAKDAVRKIMGKFGWSQAKLAEECGMRWQSNVTGVLNRGNSLRVDTLDQMISAMDYKIVLVPSDTELQDGWYVVNDNRTEDTEEEHE